jgi:dolichol-phosphate mannosyltransferase
MLLALPLENIKVMIVDDNSPDGTGRLADELAAEHPGRVQVLHRKAKDGLGRAYVHGFTVALEEGAERIVQMDADFSHPTDKIVNMAAEIDGYDLVIGSRYTEGGSLDEDWPIWRKGLSAFGNLYARSILAMPIRDVTGGFRMYTRKLLLDMNVERVRSNGYVFQVEMGYLAYLLGARIKEIPIHFADRKWGDSKMSWTNQREAALRVWQVKFSYSDLKS